jgi:hypothetical protein
MGIIISSLTYIAITSQFQRSLPANNDLISKDRIELVWVTFPAGTEKERKL